MVNYSRETTGYRITGTKFKTNGLLIFAEHLFSHTTTTHNFKVGLKIILTSLSFYNRWTKQGDWFVQK